jgi:hypothetical protein
MAAGPQQLACRSVGEWTLHSTKHYGNPFADLTVDAVFTSPSGATVSIPGFYDGAHTWRVRFNPHEPGRWQYRIASRPHDAALAAEGSFEATPMSGRGLLRATPGQAWGFHYENGEPAFVFGDTVYHLFGWAHCGADVEPFLRRRAQQGFNWLRVRVPCSPFHPPDGYSTWQTRRTWAWGGSEQAPRFDRFNLDYFATVDRVVALTAELDLGLELIMEAWGFEFPFNSRQIFTAEWEELWLRYLIARYDAYTNLVCWTPLNEYEYYPNGDWHYQPVADRWAMRIARWIKGVAQHGHIVAMHNGPREPAFAQRFAPDPEAVDAILFQDWGARDADEGWLATGIEEQIERSLEGWWGAAVFAEWGYERNPAFELLLPHHEHCDADHTRRGAWRGAFCGLGLIHGFENSWGPWMLLDEDQPGMADLLLVRRFFTELLPFHELRPAPQLIVDGPTQHGHRPRALRSSTGQRAAVYLPTGGAVQLAEDAPRAARWFDPRSGALAAATRDDGRYHAPSGGDARPHDWVLLLGEAS